MKGLHYPEVEVETGRYGFEQESKSMNPNSFIQLHLEESLKSRL